MRNLVGNTTENYENSNHRPQAHVYFSQELLKRIESKRQAPKVKLRLATQTHTSLNKANNGQNAKLPNAALSKYRTSSLSEEDINTLASTLTAYLEQTKPYLNLRLTLVDLAHALNLANHHLSQVINIGLNSNFNQLINRYRIKESLRLIEQDTAARSNITRIQYDSGFGSKSVFHRVFKHHMSMTPKTYWEQCRAENRADRAASVSQPLT